MIQKFFFSGILTDNNRSCDHLAKTFLHNEYEICLPNTTNFQDYVLCENKILIIFKYKHHPSIRLEFNN